MCIALESTQIMQINCRGPSKIYVVWSFPFINQDLGGCSRLGCVFFLRRMNTEDIYWHSTRELLRRHIKTGFTRLFAILNDWVLLYEKEEVFFFRCFCFVTLVFTWAHTSWGSHQRGEERKKIHPKKMRREKRSIIVASRRADELFQPPADRLQLSISFATQQQQPSCCVGAKSVFFGFFPLLLAGGIVDPKSLLKHKTTRGDSISNFFIIERCWCSSFFLRHDFFSSTMSRRCFTNWIKKQCRRERWKFPM